MKVGDLYEETIVITGETIQKFAEFSGDFNPIHFDDSVAIAQGFPRRIAHGMISASFFSKIYATQFPGPGSVFLGQNLKFHYPVFVEDRLFYRLEVMEKKENKPIFLIKNEVYNEDKKILISGESLIKYNQLNL